MGIYVAMQSTPLSRLAVLALCAGLIGEIRPTFADDVKIISVAPGESADVYFEFNLAGRIFLHIRQAGGWGCADLWWIVWPLGSIKDVGQKCGLVALDVPGASSFAISSKLRARAEGTPIQIGVSSNETVANHITFSVP